MIRRNVCSQTRELLSPYLDGQLYRDEQRKVEEHLGVCEACQTELESLRATVALLRLMPQATPPRSFALRTPAASRPAWQGTTPRTRRLKSAANSLLAWQGANLMRWSTALAAALLFFVTAGDLLSSFVSAPVMVPATAGVRSSAPAGEGTGASEPSNLRAPAVAATDQLRKDGRSESLGPAEPAPAATSQAASGPIPSATPARDGEGAAQSYNAANPAAVPGQLAAAAAGPPYLRIVELGLASLLAILAIAGLLTRRLRS